jgi:hypothetical protein
MLSLVAPTAFGQVQMKLSRSQQGHNTPIAVRELTPRAVPVRCRLRALNSKTRFFCKNSGFFVV